MASREDTLVGRVMFDALASCGGAARIGLVLAAAWLVYQLVRAVYNVSPLHPLYGIPGPKLAAATYWPEFYHDVILFGRYSGQIRVMHDKYGPIVRINPHEVHCDDPKFADEIYATSGRKRDKPQHQINGSALGHSGFGTMDHDLHRIRRIPLAKFFSRSMISRLESDIRALAQKLCDKLLAQAGKPAFDVTMAYSCFTSDAISRYCFGEPFGFLDQEGWYPNFREPTAAILKPVFMFRFFPFLKALTIAFLVSNDSWANAGTHRYDSLVDYLPEDTALLIRTLKMDIPNMIKKTKADMDAGIQYDRPTIFGSLLESELEVHEKQPQRLGDEATAVVGAGTETTSWALGVITYHLLTKPELLRTLRAELAGVIDDPLQLPSWTVLEKLPYMGAVVQEGLRLSFGVAARTARVPTRENLVYQGEFNKKPVQYVIPRGYAVGMSAAITHLDDRLFVNPQEFAPERWLGDAGRRAELERGMLPFSKGSRACLGMNLALCELNLALAAVALRVMPHMELFETTDRDVRYDHDMFVPMAEAGSTGVRVKISSPS
ncbi:cytochrome P450 [Purpureocillium lavendulum]|uniref:Cytochrome P450 n=1 Tax=Purpureocillium lavendulum TaxID=1247861 RepID=A0AB34FYR1_9HYPO|nr:cytochrome P450 [Purpureocillium lavendulum]